MFKRFFFVLIGFCVMTTVLASWETFIGVDKMTDDKTVHVYSTALPGDADLTLVISYSLSDDSFIVMLFGNIFIADDTCRVSVRFNGTGDPVRNIWFVYPDGSGCGLTGVDSVLMVEQISRADKIYVRVPTYLSQADAEFSTSGLIGALAEYGIQIP